MKKITSALISVFYKDGLEPLVRQLASDGVKIYSTGGTQKFIEELGVACTPVESVTSYPSILGGRVKTLHPKVFGGILYRREEEGDLQQIAEYEIPTIDLVIVDLYPFEETVAAGGTRSQIIEKIDVGGPSMIRAAAKNHSAVAVVADKALYGYLTNILSVQDGATTMEQREELAAKAFRVTANYDKAIAEYFAQKTPMRYGENPHQSAEFKGDLDAIIKKLHGKDISYNNLLDINAAVELMGEFAECEPTFAILKHNNACGVASRPTLCEAYETALSSDPISAFGGVLICNVPVDEPTAVKVNELFCEVVIAPAYSDEALEVLKSKKNRILLTVDFAEAAKHTTTERTMLGGVLTQQKDTTLGGIDSQVKLATAKAPTEAEMEELLFANKIVKHSKSNAIVLSKGKQLLGSGVGQTSRVDALKQAVAKAQGFELSLQGAVMASDAFFPFADCVEIAHNAGIGAVIQPGGSVRDEDSVAYCNDNDMAMVMTSMRHFKH